MKTFDKIVGYVFRAEVFCEKCLRRHMRLTGFMEKEDYGYKTEDFLDLKSEEEGINRGDEFSFDSTHFPKVIFASDIELEFDFCSTCSKLIS
jgi:hypothetical protein